MKSDFIQRNKIIYIILSLFLIIPLLIVYYLVKEKVDLVTGYNVNCIAAFVIYIFLFLCCFKFERQLICFYSLFLIISMAFFFGQHIVLLLHGEDAFDGYWRSILDHRIPDGNRLLSGFIILVLMLILNVGYLLSVKKKSAIVPVKSSRDLLTNVTVKRVAWMIFLIVIIPTMLKYIHDIQSVGAVGYAEGIYSEQAIEKSTSGLMKIFYFCSYFCLPSLYLLYISYSPSKKRFFIVALYFMVVLLILLSGSRFVVFESLIAILIIYNLKINRIRFKHCLLMASALIVVLIAFEVIKNTRESIGRINVLESIKKLFSDGIFRSSLIETGLTFHLVDNVFYHCPKDVSFSYGKSILGAILMAVPSFLRFGFDLDSVSTSKVFSHLYTTDVEKLGMGSSFIAEFYWNFGLFFIVAVFIFGVFIGKLSNICRFRRYKNNLSIYIYAYLSSLMCFCVRTDTVSLIRYSLLYIVFIVLLIQIVKNKKCYFVFC